MATNDRSSADSVRSELIAEFHTWASICEDKHGYQPPPDLLDRLPQMEVHEIRTHIKRLIALARTPHAD